MSRVGRAPVTVPQGVKCELTGHHLKVTGPKGTLERDLHPDMTIEVTEQEIQVRRSSDRGDQRALHGLTRALIQNMVTGVTEGYTRVLKVEGVGYRASMQGKSLNIAVGFSHPLLIEPPEGIAFEAPDAQTMKVIGIDKELVGQTSADIRSWRPPEPYKGKGIRYENERVRRKVGKAGAS